MRAARALAALRQSTRYSHTAAAGVRPVQVLLEPATFREAYRAELPALLPSLFNTLPAIKKWFIISSAPNQINASYLSRYGSLPVPLEFTWWKTNGEHSFLRAQYPLSYFLECLASSTVSPPADYFTAHLRRRDEPVITFTQAAPVSQQTTVYLAQAPISELPRLLREDLPTPEIILRVGKGDVYDSSIWIGNPPTYTPLHRDPNPNLFIQLSGMKRIRLFRPAVGRGILAKVQESIGSSGSANIRGDEMMAGEERVTLDKEVWHVNSEFLPSAYEALLHPGDALFIPKGWWHSVKSVGNGINGSANWWFR